MRNTVRVPLKTTLRVHKTDGNIGPLAGTDSVFPSVVKSNLYWLIPVPPTAPTEQVILGAFVPRVEHQNDSGIWTRRIVGMPSEMADAPNESTFVCILDDTTLSYGAALQGAVVDISRDNPATFTEEWTLKKRGR